MNISHPKQIDSKIHAPRIIMPLALATVLLAWVWLILSPRPVVAANQNISQPPPLFISADATVAPDFIQADGVVRYRAVWVEMPALQAPQINLNLFSDLNLLAIYQKTIPMGSDSFVWQGTLKGEHGSTVLLSFNRGILVGKIRRITGETYQLQYTPDGYLLKEVDLPHEETILIVPADLGEEGKMPAQIANNTPTNHAPAQQPAATMNDGSQVTLMVLYTPAARNAAGGTTAIEAEINMVMAEMNQVLVNSQLNFTLDLVHTTELSASEAITYEGGMINSVLSNEFPEVKIWRDQYSADIVSIWGENKPDNAAGIAFQFGEIDIHESEYAYHQVRRDHAINGYTMIHEVGHNMAAGHGVYSLTLDLQDRVHPYAFGYGDETAGFFTIMGANVSPTMTVPIPYFSNPNVFTNGAPMGTVYSITLGYGENNVRAMNEVATLVSNYRLSPPADQTLLVDSFGDNWLRTGCLDNVPNDCSLRGAIRLANADVTTRPYTITLPTPQTYIMTATSTVYIDDNYAAYGDYDINGTITIEGNGSTIDANGLSRVFHVQGADSAFTLRNTTVRGGINRVTEEGGGIYVQNGQLTLINSHVMSNTTQWRGGGISSRGGAVILRNSSVVDNTSLNEGGGIYINHTMPVSGGVATVSILDNVIVARNQSSTKQGGGLHILFGDLMITNSQIVSNIASSNGGGIFHNDGMLSIAQSTIAYNRSSNEGGGIRIQNGPLMLINSQIISNTAQGNGGGISTHGNSIWLTNTHIISNTAGGTGGGLELKVNTLTIEGSTFSNNDGPDGGGGLHGLNVGMSVINNARFESNRTNRGGGGFYLTGTTLRLSNSHVLNNRSVLSGGGLNYIGGTMTVDRSHIIGNAIDPQGNNANGGGISAGAVTTVTRSVIMSNTSELSGGGITAFNTLTVLSTTFSANQVSAWPSAIYGYGSIQVVDSTLTNNHGGIAARTDLRLQNSTLSANQGDAIWLVRNGATAFITQTTIVSNSNAGIWSAQPYATQVIVQGSIIAHHPGGDCLGELMVTTSQGHNLTGDSSCGFSNTGDVVDSNTLLGPLALNGGITANHTPLTGSPALDGIPAGNCLVSHDQRGVPRPFNTLCDKGSVEYMAETMPVAPMVTISNTAGTAVMLNWLINAGNCNYTVQSSTQPYSGFGAIGTTTTGTYSDNNGAGNPLINYFYQIVASSCPVGAQTAISNRVGEFDFAIVPGN